MVRQKTRKTAEELYATAAPPPPLGTTRFDENFFQNSKSCKNHKMADNNSVGICRKKTKGPTTLHGGAEKKDEKTYINEGRFLGKGKGGRSKKSDPFESSSLDNKHLSSFVGESEKDEDTEEFLDLIRETVETAVVKTLSDILNRNFREVSGKIEDLREQLHTQETKLEKIQTDLTNKIAHYGEENSRHFRYLCMKSEYDKMFYQHQNVMNAIPAEGRPNIINPYPQQFPTAGPPVPPSQATPAVTQCNCHHNQGGGDFGGPARSKTTVSTKSSEMGIKEIKGLLEQLQRFYENQQGNEKVGRKNSRGSISLPERDDSAEGDDDDSSDDNMSAESIEEKLGDCGDC